MIWLFLTCFLLLIAVGSSLIRLYYVEKRQDLLERKAAKALDREVEDGKDRTEALNSIIKVFEDAGYKCKEIE